MPGDGLWEYGGLHQGHIKGLFCVDRGGIKQGQLSIFLVNKEGPKPFLPTGPVAAIPLWAQNQDCTSRPLLNAAPEPVFYLSVDNTVVFKRIFPAHAPYQSNCFHKNLP
jgi:hypothetical protein